MRTRWVLGVLVVLVAAFAARFGFVRASRAAPPPVRGVILMVGDGMGIATVTAARIHRGALEGLERPVSGTLHLDAAPRSALVHTWALDDMVTDSAAGITALMCGAKTLSGAIGVAPNADGGLDTLRNLLEIAESMGLSTGIVTTTRLTHATPAGCYAHELDRGQENDIALSLLPGVNPLLGDGVEVILGGGSRHFVDPGADDSPMGAHAPTDRRRTDGRDLTAEMAAAGYRVVADREELQRAVDGGVERIFGLFSPSHMTYVLDREAKSPDEPSLVEMTRAALKVLERNPRGYFLLVEGGRIDHALHENRAAYALAEMLEFDDAIGEAASLPSESHVVVVTADHDHTMVIAGYAPSSADVLTIAGTDEDGHPYPALLFGNGPGGRRSGEPVVTAESVRSPDFRSPAAIPLDGETHGGMDVPLYAFGPARIVDRIPGSLNNSDVFGILRGALRGE